MHYKLSKTPEVLKEYDDIIQEQLASGIIEKVPNPEVERRNKEDVHYLPHHVVIRQNRETTKLRIVYDGSAKSPGQDRSLNDCLPVGPNYIPQLVDVLTRFRWNRIAISADKKESILDDQHPRKPQRYASLLMAERSICPQFRSPSSAILPTSIWLEAFPIHLRGYHYTSFRFLQGTLSRISEVDKRFTIR